MKKFLFLFAIALPLFFVACENNGDTTTDDTDTLHEDTDVVIIDSTERIEYKTKVQREIDTLRAKIKQMEEEGETKSKSTWNEEKTRFERELDSLERDLERAGDRTEQEWEEFKSEVNRTVDTLENRWDRLFEDDDVDVRIEKK